MSDQCAGITKEGTRCTRSAEGANGLCWLHNPSRSEERRRAASKAGRSKSNRELTDIKRKLSDLADDVLEGNVMRGTAAVAGQIYNVLLRAISTEMKVREVEELEERLSSLEEAAERDKGRGSRWRGA